jgi:hypothetical protein
LRFKSIGSVFTAAARVTLMWSLPMPSDLSLPALPTILEGGQR